MRGSWRIRQWIGEARRFAERRRAMQAVAAFPLQSAARSHNLDTELIVSLTSYPARFATLALTLRGLLDQTVRPDRTVLWIAHADHAMLPADVLALSGHGLEIRLCDDTRSYKKLVAALQAFPGAAIVTADDDVYYPPRWLETLLAAATDAPGAIVAHRAHHAHIGHDGRFAAYANWDMAVASPGDDPPGRLLFPTGHGGVFYPARSLDPRVCDVALFTALCPTADDVWFFWMGRLNGTAYRGASGLGELLNWDGTDETALFHQNWLGNENDTQIAAMEDRFGTLREIMIASTGHQCHDKTAA
ncbi:MAG: hypothetical protein ABI673_03370 [Novosphingobium sp.]